MRPTRRMRGTDVFVTAALGATLVVLAGSWLQSLRSVREHEAVVDETLEAYASFAAERLASELDGVFAAHFLREIGFTREVHHAWRAGTPTVERPTSVGWPNPEHLDFFSLTDSVVISHGATDPASLAWVAAQVRAHEPGLPRPAPYAVLRGRSSTAIVYRSEGEGSERSVYGFVLDLRDTEPWLERVARRTPLLPRTLSVASDPETLLHVTIGLHPEDDPWVDFGLPDATGPTAWAFAAKAARLAVGVTIDRNSVTPLTALGASAATVRSLAVLGALTLLLTLVSIRLILRTIKLAELRDRFVANVSHDLRTPITQLRLFSEMLQSGRLSDEADRARALTVIRRQSELLSDLVANILEADTPRPGIAPVDTDLEPLVTEVVLACGAHAAARGTRLTVDWPAGTRGPVDPLAFRRILTNLVDNALRHAQAKAVRLRIHPTARSVTVEVEDDGIGVPAEDRERIFDRFEQTESQARRGRGLGLSVVRELARRHDGDVWIEPVTPRGARFVVRLGAA